MKPLLLRLLLGVALLVPATAAAQKYPVDTLVKTGPLDQRINLLLLPDGYQASEMPLFKTRARAILAALFSQTPFQEYQAYFNVFAVEVPSPQSGATHPNTAPDCGSVPAYSARTAFGATYDAFNIHRLLMPQYVAVGTVAVASFPNYDQLIVLSNSADYGGSGGVAATVSADGRASEIAIHELGHSLAGLADEYWAGEAYAAERPNMTQDGNPATTRWAAWLGDQGIGLIHYATNPSWYKPYWDCKMERLGSPFCAVCRQAFVEKFHYLVKSLQGYQPTTPSVSSTASGAQFSLALLPPQPNTLRVTWTLDGKVVARNTATLSLTPARLGAVGTHTVQATVLDTTALTRATLHATQHLYTVSWQVTQTVLDTRTSAALAATYEVSTFPNPVADELRLRYTLPHPGPAALTVLDAAGRTVATRHYPQQAAGPHEVLLRPQELGLSSAGMYTLRLELDGVVLSRPLVRQ